MSDCFFAHSLLKHPCIFASNTRKGHSWLPAAATDTQTMTQQVLFVEATIKIVFPLHIQCCGRVWSMFRMCSFILLGAFGCEQTLPTNLFAIDHILLSLSCALWMWQCVTTLQRHKRCLTMLCCVINGFFLNFESLWHAQITRLLVDVGAPPCLAFKQTLKHFVFQTLNGGGTPIAGRVMVSIS